MIKKAFACALAITSTACSTQISSPKAQTTNIIQRQKWIHPDKETKDQKNERMQWWRQARFGMFIHWGVYSVPGGIYKGKPASAEWIMLRSEIPVDEYRDYAKDFNPVKYDPESWVLLAKEAGMKYMVITAKHHDGFALYDSKVTDWDIADASPYGKDLLKPLAEACRKHGMKLGFYYSQAQDWVHAGGAKHKNLQWDPKQKGSFEEYFKKIAAPQIKEILSNYGDIAVLWWDTPVGMRKKQAQMTFPYLAKQPAIITNNRLGGGVAGDTETPEQYIPTRGYPGRDWETCMTMNNSWGYRYNDKGFKSTTDLIRKLSDISSKSGNFLLNVGPTKEGELPQESIKGLKEIGAWMEVNSEAIYNTQGASFTFIKWGRVTQKKLKSGKTRLYLHVWHWPENGQLVLPMTNKVQNCFLLDGKKKIMSSQSENNQTLHLPKTAPDVHNSIIVVDIEGDPSVTSSPYVQASKDNSFTLDTEKVIFHGHGPGKQFVISGKETPKVTQWKEKKCWIEWGFESINEGSYEVVVEVDGQIATNSNLTAIIEFLGTEGHLKRTHDKRGRTLKPKGQHIKKVISEKDKGLRKIHLGKVDVKKGIYRLGLFQSGKDLKGFELLQVYLKPVK